MILTLKCPKCHNTMEYAPRDKNITKKTKRCVYCGTSFKVHTNPKKSRIL